MKLFVALPPRLLGMLLLLVLAAASPAHAAPRGQPQAPDVASYQMDVRLDPAAKTVSGHERIRYQNPSPDTLQEIWLRLYLKAFANKNTVWMRESGGTMRGYAIDFDHPSDITVSALRLGGADLLPSTTITDTLMHVPLPAPLAPGQALELDVEWQSHLPHVFARTGYGGRDNTFFMVGQWYPKMTVYDRGHWDTEPWHSNAEFFNDFGSYNVAISLPREYVVAATGVPGGETDAGDGLKKVTFSATSVTDFAFAASPDFRTRSARAGDVDVELYYLPEHAAAADEYMDVAVGSLQAYSSWYGAYPHPRLSVVDVPDSAGGAGGMEYPMLVTGGTLGMPTGSGFIGLVTAHEIGHEWWPMQTATNEAREPWLDEGITEYSGMRYMLESGRKLGFGKFGLSADVLDRGTYGTATDQPSNLPSWEYDGSAYDGAVYGKTAVGLLMLERVVGTERFRQAMSSYLAAYRYKHPDAADFRQSLEQSLGGDLGWFFDDFIGGTGIVDYAADPITQMATGSHVSIRRVGSVRVPVEVAVTLRSGAQQTVQCDGQSRSCGFDFPSTDPVTQVQIDPQRKLAAELDITNNGVRASPAVTPALTLGGRLLFLFQMLGQLLGFFG